MNHEPTQRSISGYLRGELGAEAHRDFLAHIRDCPRCNSELAIATRLQTELPQAAPYHARIGTPLPAALAAKVRASVASQGRRRRPLGWLDWLFPGAQPNLLRGAANVLGVFLLLAAFAVGAIALRNAFQPGPARPGYAANFTWSVEQDLTYIFTDTTITSDTLTYRWDFGDGGISAMPNPNHTYSVAGVYTVSMAISGPRGKGDQSRAVQVGLSVALTTSPTPTAPPSPTAFLPGPITPTFAPAPPNTPTPPAISTPALPGQPTPTLPGLDPLPSPSPLPAQPTIMRRPPSPTPSQLPTYAPTRTPLPQPSDTPLAEPTRTPMLEPTRTPMLEPSRTPLPSETPRPLPTGTPLPLPSNTPRPEPSSTPRPEPSSTPRPEPSSTPRPEPSDTPMPLPSDTPVPTETPGCVDRCGPTETPVPPTYEPSHTPPSETPTPMPTHEPPPTETPHPPPGGTPHDPTQTPGPTCTPRIGDGSDNQGRC